jgi:hypothetical protein
VLPDHFFVGVDTHMIGIDLPIMCSDLRLKRRKRLNRAARAVMIDSGSFTIHDTGQQFDPELVYVDRIRRYQQDVGNIVAVATYGRMCEPDILAKTGSTIERNQCLTIESYCSLAQLAPDVPWLPEIQGWQESDYHLCIDMYADAGIDLAALPAVGVGTICRREGTIEAQRIISGVAARGIKVHGFGVKTSGLKANHRNFHSADSFAWSYGARKQTRECPHGIVRWERNCPEYLKTWHANVLRGLIS